MTNPGVSFECNRRERWTSSLLLGRWPPQADLSINGKNVCRATGMPIALPYAAVTAPFCALIKCLAVLAVRISAATSHAAAVQPRLITEVKLKTREPSAAPSEKPRYMNEALSDKAMGVPRSPARLISTACWAG